MSNEMMNHEVQEAVKMSLDLRMEIGSFLSFADFFFDDIVSDYLVQSKIEDAREQVDDAVWYIEEILNGLQGQRKGEV